MKEEKQHRIIIAINKRPVIMAALVCVVQILCVVYTAGIYKYIITLCLNAAMFLTLKRKGTAAFLCVLSLFVFYNADILYRDSLKCENININEEFVVQIMDYADRDEKKVSYKVNLTDGHQMHGIHPDNDILLTVYDPSLTLRTGDIYRISGKLRGVKGSTNPHTFNYKNHLLSKNIKYTLTAETENISFMHDSHLPFCYEKIFSLRQSFESLAKLNMNEKAYGLLMGIMFASDNVDSEILEDFRMLNVAHVLAVSGLHVGIVYSFFMMIISLIKIKSLKVKTVLQFMSMLFITVYIILSGTSVSAIRAGFMVFMSFIASSDPSLNKRYDTLNTLGVILLISVAVNPFVILGASFILSYAAVASIAFINPLVANRLKSIPWVKDNIKHKVVSYFISMMSVSVSVQIGMFPVNLIIFGKVCLLSFVYNILIVPLITVSLILGIIGFVVRIIACPIFGMTEILLDIAAKTAGFFAENDISTINTYSINPLFVSLYYSVLIFVTGYISPKNKSAVIAVCVFILICATASLPAYLTQGASVSFLDVGFGDSAVILTDGGKCIVIDGGGGFYGGDTAGNILLPYLYGEGIRKIDAVIATHSDADHMGGIVGMIGKIPIDTVYANDDGGVLYDELKSLADKYGIIMKNAYSGDSITFPGCEINILSPDDGKEYSLQNDYSVVADVDIEGVKILFTGDANRGSEMTVLENSETFALKYDILKSAHHGSLFATDEFMTRLFTDICIISVGDNGYGLPKEEYINSLSAVGVKCLRTDEYGLIKIVPTGNSEYDIMNYTGGWHEVR